MAAKETGSSTKYSDESCKGSWGGWNYSTLSSQALMFFFLCCRKKSSERSSIQKSVNTRKMYLLWFNFIFGSNFIFLCFKLIIIHYNTQKQRKIKFEPRIRLNHTISMPLANPLCLSWNVSVDPFLFHKTEENH